MDAAYRTPIWLSGGLALAVIALALVFGLMQFMHAKKATLEEQASSLRTEIKTLRTQDGALLTRIASDGPLVKLVQTKRKLLEDVTNETNTAKSDIETLVGKCKESAQATKDSADKSAASRTQLIQEAKDRRTELAEVEKNKQKTERDFDTRRDQLRDEIAIMSQQLDAERKKQIKEVAGYDARLAQLTERIQELTRQREISHQDVQPDGKILVADSTAGFVIIDLGRQHSLRKGLKFAVYNRRGGRNVVKGSIEVTKVDNTIATCRVLEEREANDPLVTGDLIANPVFDRDKIKTFTVRGDFIRFSKDELKRFITESGGRYDEQLSVTTDYLVAGEHADDSLIEANKLGISVLSEEQLIDSQLFRLTASRSTRD